MFFSLVSLRTGPLGQAGVQVKTGQAYCPTTHFFNQLQQCIPQIWTIRPVTPDAIVWLLILIHPNDSHAHTRKQGHDHMPARTRFFKRQCTNLTQDFFYLQTA
jgi:hypothetical protein